MKVVIFAAGLALGFVLSALAFMATATYYSWPSHTALALNLRAKPLSHDAITTAVAPKLVEMLERNKPSIVHSAGGWPARAAVKCAWGIGVREIPTVTHAGVEFTTDVLGHYSVHDLMKYLENHLEARKRSSAGDDDDPDAGRLLDELRVLHKAGQAIGAHQ